MSEIKPSLGFWAKLQGKLDDPDFRREFVQFAEQVAEADLIANEKPAPAPLPWERLDATPYWRHREWDEFALLRDLGTGDDPAYREGGYFIPADLIKALRGVRWDAAGNKQIEVQALLDAADGAK